MRTRITADIADNDWITLRREFIPELSEEDHVDFLRAFAATLPEFQAFIALDNCSRAVGFAEASIRTEPVNGCRPGRVAFLEGIYVQPELRGRGYAKLLCLEVERWGVSQGCREFASDVFDDDVNSIAAHQALGFVKTECSVFFRKPISSDTALHPANSK